MKQVLSISTTLGLLIILALSVSLLPSEKVELVLPNEKKEVVYNAYTRYVELVTNFLVPVEINISRIDRQTHQLEPIVTGMILEKSARIKLNTSGFFLFQILSPELIQLTFRDSGLKTGLIFSGILLLAIKVVIWLYDLNIIFVNPQF